MNVLFFTVSAGEGHNQVANTLAEAIVSIDKDSNVQIIDTINYVNPKLHKVIMEGYIKSIKYLPELYGFFYKKTEETDSSLHEVGEIINKVFIARKLLKLLYDFNPDIIVCTHPFPAEALSILKRKNKINVPIITTVTDYTLHPFWFNKEVDYYILPSELFKYELNYWQVPIHKVKFFGIPVKKQFLKELNRNEICKKLKVANTFTALIMGGGLGLGKISDTIDYLISYKVNMQIIVITGKNENLYNQLKEKYISDNEPSNLKVFGYVSNIEEFMTASDVIITKPGGLTVSEAIIKDLPIIITCNLPGQEEKNTEFILNNGIGMLALTPNSLISCLNLLKEDKERYDLIKDNMSKLKKPNAVSDIANFILNLKEKEASAL